MTFSNSLSIYKSLTINMCRIVICYRHRMVICCHREYRFCLCIKNCPERTSETRSAEIFSCLAINCTSASLRLAYYSPEYIIGVSFINFSVFLKYFLRKMVSNNHPKREVQITYELPCFFTARARPCVSLYFIFYRPISENL